MSDSWFPRCRMAWLERQAKSVGHIGRSDLIRMFGISPAQASGDIQDYIAMNPPAFTYSTSRKRYEWNEGSEVVITPSPWEALITDSAQQAQALAGAEKLRSAAQAFLDDMIDRAKMRADYDDKPVELPVGNGVLHDLREALAGIEGVK